jgi:outer membrane protein assembly factor BamA
MGTFSRALTLLLLTLPAAAQNTIDKVVFHNAAPYTDAELLATSGLKVGQLLAPDSLVVAAHNLLDTGLFDDAQINLTGPSKARTVVLDLKPIPLDKLLPVSFRNLVWFTPAELTEGLHTRVPLYHGVASDAGNFPDTLQTALQQMLADKSITATLTHSVIEPTNLHPVRVVDFSVDQPHLHLATVHLSFSGPAGSAAALTPGLQQAVNKATRISFNEGLAGVTLEDLLLAPARNAGYITAKLDSTERTVAPSDNGFAVTYTTRIVSGDPYKLSAITCEPTPIYSAADFTRDNTLNPGDLANASALAKIEHTIEVAYHAHGYLDAYLLPSPTLDDTAHTVAYALHAVPGDIYHLKSVTPLHLSPDAQKEFDAGWLMKPGDIYNESYVSGFIHANTALLHLATYAASFQSSADPQTHLVDLTINFIAPSR